MVGPPSSWSRDQEELLGTLGQQTIHIAGVPLPRGRPFPSCQPSTLLCQQVDLGSLVSRQLAARGSLREWSASIARATWPMSSYSFDGCFCCLSS
jgi:hypothetical protein